jgi:hypothetical protein
MGRPLNKKYFGNRNVGSASTTADDKIGGEGVASIDNPVPGSIIISNTYKYFPTLTVAAPGLPGGVTALTATTWEIESIVITAPGSAGTGYTINQTGASAVLTGLSIQASVAPVVTINTNGSGNVSAISVAGGRGEWTSIDGTGISTWGIVGAGGTNAQAYVKFRVKRIAITEQGSGYVALPSLSWTTLGGTAPSGNTPTLTTEQTVGGNQYASQSGAQNVASYDENAILIYAKTTIGGTSRLGDIVSQKGRSVFKIKTTDGTANCLLKASAVSAAGECTITATDSDNGTYFVTKISSHRCTVTQGTGSQFVTGQSVPWTFGSAVNGVSVKIPNA